MSTYETHRYENAQQIMSDLSTEFRTQISGSSLPLDTNQHPVDALGNQDADQSTVNAGDPGAVFLDAMIDAAEREDNYTLLTMLRRASKKVRLPPTLQLAFHMLETHFERATHLYEHVARSRWQEELVHLAALCREAKFTFTNHPLETIVGEAVLSDYTTFKSDLESCIEANESRRSDEAAYHLRCALKLDPANERLREMLGFWFSD